VQTVPTLVVTTFFLAILSGILREVLGGYEFLHIGSYTMHALDPVCVLLPVAIISLLASSQKLEFTTISLPIFALAFVVAISWIRGVPQYGI